MSDPEVPQPEQPADVNDVVDSAKAGLDAAAAAGADVPASAVDADSADVVSADDTSVDPDLAAFEEMERAHPGTFATTSSDDEPAVAEADAVAASDETVVLAKADDAETTVLDDATSVTSVYDKHDDAPTQIVPDEPVIVAPAAVQPIFVQAPEPPRDRGNRGAAGGIGLLATIVFAILFLGVVLGLGAIRGDVTTANIGEAALAPLTTWGFWVPVVAFFFGFWFLGAIINRGSWGRWVVFGLIVGVISYLGYVLGQLVEAPFWTLTSTQGLELFRDQLLSPLAITAFVLGRELTIWFGAWVARSGARKTELNAEAQREYERTLEAGPSLPR